jgi:hypothetical protein
MKTSYYFAQAYGEGKYGSGTYSCTQQQQDQGICTMTAATGTGNNNGSGGLTNTGIAIVAIVSVACLLMFVAMIVRIWRRPRLVAQSAAAPAATAPESDRSDDLQQPAV